MSRKKKTPLKINAESAAPDPVQEAPRPGRPDGTPNKVYSQVVAKLSRCNKQGCGSTERAPYIGKPVERTITGVDADGNRYTHVVWRRTKCRACGQYRVDRTYENRVPASSDVD